MSEKDEAVDFRAELDLKLERIVDVPRRLVWEAWTQPKHLMQWFCPKPWSVSDCEIDLRPGGIFSTTMRSPEGVAFPNVGCYLEIVENEKLVWTDALLPGYRPTATPQSGAGLLFTAILLLGDAGSGTKYTAIAKHRDSADRKKHEEMGFHDGWSTVLDQLVEVVRRDIGT